MGAIKQRGNNQVYMDKYISLMTEEGRNLPSIQQYTCRVGQFADSLNGKDLLSATSDDLENFLNNGNEYKRNHINGFFKSMLKYNINDLQNTIDHSLLLYLAMN